MPLPETALDAIASDKWECFALPVGTKLPDPAILEQLLTTRSLVRRDDSSPIGIPWDRFTRTEAPIAPEINLRLAEMIANLSGREVVARDVFAEALERRKASFSNRTNRTAIDSGGSV